MAKKKSTNNKKNTPNMKSYAAPFEKLAIAICFCIIAVTLIGRFLFDWNLGPIFWIATAVFVVKLIIFGILDRSYTYYVKKLHKKFNEWKASRATDDDDDDDDYEDVDDVDDDDDDDTVDMAAFGFTRVETVIDGVTVTLDKPDDALLGNAKDNAWTAISKKKPDGKVVYAVVERPKLVPAKLKADEEVGPLNVVKKKKPAAKPADAADKALAAKLLAKGCAPADLVKKVADAKALIATGLFTEDEAIAHVSK